jgi:NAD(P)-dependent dehydrogenase (short-subunit alcohol dehydrogenase family)
MSDRPRRRLNGRSEHTPSEENIMLLQDKVAVIYGAGGSIGRAVALAFAREGATLFLTGRHAANVEAVAAAVREAGGTAQVDVVDALDADAVSAHADAVVAAAGRLDISLNLVTRGDVQGIPLADMTVEDLLRPVATGVTANFVTARAAARHMAKQGGGVILAVNSGSAHGSPMMGGTGLADAATDTLIRNLALELGPSGVRAAGVWVAGIPETLTVEKLSAVNAGIDAAAVEGILAHLASLRMTKRSPRLSEVADTFAFLASDSAAGMTGTWLNVTAGMFAS